MVIKQSASKGRLIKPIHKPDYSQVTSWWSLCLSVYLALVSLLLFFQFSQSVEMCKAQTIFQSLERTNSWREPRTIINILLYDARVCTCVCACFLMCQPWLLLRLWTEEPCVLAASEQTPWDLLRVALLANYSRQDADVTVVPSESKSCYCL